MTLSQKSLKKGIFSFTELKADKPLPIIKSSSFIRGYTSRNTPSSTMCEDFLKSNIKKGNLSPREISKTTKELLLSLEEKTRQ